MLHKLMFIYRLLEIGRLHPFMMQIYSRSLITYANQYSININELHFIHDFMVFNKY